MTFSKKTRQEAIKNLKDKQLDVLIIGGGITGAGLAVQAAASGMSTALLEMQDFAEGTSSRSTKLVHGGIRYLKNFDVEVVSDTVTERAVVQGIAPHIPKPDPMLLPIYNDEGPTTFDMFSVKVAMDLYDRLAGVENTPFANYTISPEEVLRREPLLKKEGLQGAGVYLDFRNNDARLVIDNIKKASEDGAIALSKVKVTDFLYEDRKIVGVKARDLLSGTTFEVKAKLVVNTSGPWVDKIRTLNFTRAVLPKMRPTKGVHLVVDASKLPVPQPTYFDTGKKDKRMVFAIPRENKTYFGTTDTDYTGDLQHPTVTQEDVDYLLEVINYRYPEAHLTINDIESSWAGIRPLLADNSGSDYNGGDNGAISEESFKDVINIVTQFQKKEATKIEVEAVLNHLESSLAEKGDAPSSVSRGSSLEQEEDGLITLAGGKITDYRKMAAGAMTLIAQLLKENYGLSFKTIDSKHYQISGGEFDPTQVTETVAENMKAGLAAGLSETEARYIADFYGMNALKIFAYAKEMNAYDGLSLAESACLRYGLEDEMVLVPADYLLRRTNHILFQRESLDSIQDAVIAVMADVLEWTADEKAANIETYKKVLAENDLADLKAN
ncbi:MULTISPECIES: type 1 glycerol-3-phosphate oxidase [unclassified Lactococcus]|uniref:type 1 glycerol-3-phosphate oxidase n=1 Tax=unclassified Lactococcus TaxID=2643510 RepID=UPI0011C754B6|nr:MULTISPECIES: type 1 glycerol-3-phosphate oxidase [unclassified Lactococcus]MQW23393.1 type 1 glycerol-3-phosphate oxidase [Lactococcus sp. dk101]TXK37908.1 type 1 glycerol-3-phosphate oxidase [Lactococcus sp. dk310]TXK49562.1 type 1 glycerol-3-phosphate oxidase [Lactococcus sp. dk322]